MYYNISNIHNVFDYALTESLVYIDYIGITENNFWIRPCSYMTYQLVYRETVKNFIAVNTS